MKKIFLLTALAVLLSASTVYTLSGVKKVYPVIEVSGKGVSKSFKAKAREEIVSVLDELGISHGGYDQRALALLVNAVPVNGLIEVTIKLEIGEQVLRLDSKEKTFALTYLSLERVRGKSSEEVEDKLEDALFILLDKFSEQYKEENKKIVKVNLKSDDFSKLGYETNYDAAVKKAQKLKKPVLLVLVANYCPWCRKFEEKVLRKKDVHELIMKNYIPVIINKEKGGFPKELDIAFTPIIHFINYKTLRSEKMIAGYNNKDEFLYTLKNFTIK